MTLASYSGVHGLGLINNSGSSATIQISFFEGKDIPCLVKLTNLFLFVDDAKCGRGIVNDSDSSPLQKDFGAFCDVNGVLIDICDLVKLYAHFSQFIISS